jgi:hypothetical protein
MVKQLTSEAVTILAPLHNENVAEYFQQQITQYQKYGYKVTEIIFTFKKKVKKSFFKRLFSRPSFEAHTWIFHGKLEISVYPKQAASKGVTLSRSRACISAPIMEITNFLKEGPRDELGRTRKYQNPKILSTWSILIDPNNLVSVSMIKRL